MAKKTKSTNKKPMSKGGKIAIISISAALVIGGGVTAFVFSNQIKEFIDKWFHGAKIETVDNEYQTEKGVVEYNETTGETKELPYKYLGSAEQSVIPKDETDPQKISAHTFLIGRVNSVPFYQSGWTKFEYENVGMTISFSQISTTSVSNSLATTNERVESSSWSQSTHFEETFKASVEGGIGPVKAKAENTINFQIDKSSAGSTLQRYVSSNEQTNTSIETLQKTADYSVQLNSRNGFKKGKYYRMTLQQSASMYMIIYEKAGKPTEQNELRDGEEPVSYDKYYELTSYLADPSNYTMVIEEADDTTAEPKESAKFDSALYDQCAQWIDDVRNDSSTEPGFEYIYVEDKPEPDPVAERKALLDEKFGGEVTAVKSDQYVRDSEYRITDAGKNKNPSDKVTFPTFFKSKGSPTFAELFNPKEEELPEDQKKYAGYGFKTVDIELEFEYRRYDHAFSHIYLVDKSNGDIQHIKEDDISKSWTYRRVVWSGVDAIDRLRTTMDYSRADGCIHIKYDGSGKSSDDWGIRKLRMEITIRK